MTPLMMHWHLVLGSDGKWHLDMAWESARIRKMAPHSRPQGQPGVKHK